MKKYKLTDKTKKVDGRILYQIEALRDFGDVKKGDLGGWVESEDNLSHNRDCWIYDNGMVFDRGWVYGYGKVSENGKVYGNGQVYGDGEVFGYGEVFDNGFIFDSGRVYGNGKVFDNGEVFGNGKVFANGRVYGESRVFENAQITGNTKITGYSEISGNIALSDNNTYYNVAISDEYNIQAKFEVGDKVVIDGKVDVIENMYFCIGNRWIYTINKNHYFKKQLIKLEPEVEELFNI